ncbi:MAG: STAS domain-containing protein [Gammaproteobacteria bacterium]|nr:STAS domain-containing protein [Gammaproteobacteria bacterium]
MSRFTLALPDSLTIYNVASLCELWQQQLSNEHGGILLDVSALQELDGAGFQLVLGLVKHRVQHCAVLQSQALSSRASWLISQLSQLGVQVEE